MVTAISSATKAICQSWRAMHFPIRELRTGHDPLGEIAAYRYFISMDKQQLEGYQGFVCESDETALGVIAALKDKWLSRS